jgi:hypothetical protein
MLFASQIVRSPFDLLRYATIGAIAPRSHLLIACMPKSGSTYLSNAISRLPNFHKVSLVRQYGRVEQDLNVETALRKDRYNYVAQHHVKYNENTQFVLNKFDIKPVVLVRNIFDCVISVRDHLRRESTLSPSAWFGERHKKLNDDELSAMISHLVVPWYIHFYVSWKNCPDALLLTYDDYVRDVPGTIGKICAHADLPFGAAEIEQAIASSDPGEDRLNVGQSGRGATLDEENRALIHRFRTFYPTIDFSPIGLD